MVLRSLVQITSFGHYCLELNLMEVDIGPTEQVEASVIALHPIYETYGMVGLDYR